MLLPRVIKLNILLVIICTFFTFKSFTIKAQVYEQYKNAKCYFLRDRQNKQLFEELKKQNPSVQVVKGLLEDCADANAEKRQWIPDTADPFRVYSERPITLAKNHEILETLLDHGASIEEVDFYHGQTPLMRAAERQDLDSLELLLKRGAKVNKKNRNEETPLFLSVAYDGTSSNSAGKTAATALLLKYGADINVGNKEQTPLMWAAENGTAKQVEFLINHNADVNLKSKFDNRTALHFAAASKGKEKFGKLAYLLKAKAYPNAVDRYGFTPLDLLYKNGEPSTGEIALLLSYDARRRGTFSHEKQKEAKQEYTQQAKPKTSTQKTSDEKSSGRKTNEKKTYEQNTQIPPKTKRVVSDYEILGIPHDSSLSAIKKAFRNLALKWHPDKNSANPKLARDKMTELNAAYERLTKSKKSS